MVLGRRGTIRINQKNTFIVRKIYPIMNEEQKGYLELILFSLFAGIIGIIVRLIKNLDIYSVIFFRAIIAVIFLFIVIILKRGIKELFLVWPFRTLLIGLFEGISIFLYFGSILRTSISNAVFLVYTAPIFSIILAKFFLKEEIERETIFGMFLTLLGIIFILDPRTFASRSQETIGNLMGLGAGFFYSVITFSAKPLLKRVSGYYTAFWQYLVVSFMFLFFINIKSFNGLYANWWQLTIMGVLCTGIAFVLFMEGLKKIKAQKVLIITTIEPLAGTLAALLVLKENPSLLTIIGAVLIIYGIYRVTWAKPAL